MDNESTHLYNTEIFLSKTNLHSSQQIASIPNLPSSKEIWKDIINQRNEDCKKLEEYLSTKKYQETNVPPNPELNYLNENIFPILLPILEKTIFKAIKMECLKHQKSIFNGIDYIAELLWNTNSKYPDRSQNNLNIFLMPWVQEWLNNQLSKTPRPIFPKSWIWTKEIASLKIQAYVRGHFVRKTDEVQEMRQFWKAIKRERLEKEKLERENQDEYGED